MVAEHRSPVMHSIKCWPGYFEGILSGAKPFELRRNDRDYRIGDTLHIKEWLPLSEEFTGRAVYREITYVLEHFSGLEHGYCILGLFRASDKRDILELSYFS